jgi:hypothetical protein
MLPSSGVITMGDIRTELGVPSQAPFSLNTATNGGYGSINPASPNKPSGADPDALSEWYGYDHNTGNVTMDVFLDPGVTLTSRFFKNGSQFLLRTSSGTSFGLIEPGDTFYAIVSSRSAASGATLTVSSDQRGELYYENKDVGVSGNLTSPTFTLQYREVITVIVQGYTA